MIRRLALAWHVLRGRPLAYRVEFVGRGGVFNQLKNGKIVECVFTADPTTPEALAAGEAGVWIGQNSSGVEFKDVKLLKLLPPEDGDVILNKEWWYSDSPSDRVVIKEEDKI